jgi:uncharacterized lipoprotein YehR (DUF1307 family)
MNVKNKMLAGVSAMILASGLSGCTDQADVVRENLSKAADNFEVTRRIVFFTTSDTGADYLMVVEGVCAIFDQGTQLEVICKEGPHTYKKHMLGLNAHVSYFVEQGVPVTASSYHTRITFMPQAIVPDPDFQGSTAPQDLPRSQP